MDAEAERKAITKDVGQVTSLAYVLSELQWIAYCFGEDKVSQDTLDKVNQAISLLLEAIKDQAELGKKSFVLNDATIKTGRTISTKHEGLLKEASDHMTSAVEKVKSVLDTVAEKEEEQPKGEPKEEPKSVGTSNDFLTKLANSLKTNNQ